MRDFLVLTALGVFLASAAAAEANYEISRYSATLTLRDNSRDVDVALDITYRILSGTKSEGFKYVGQYPPHNIEAFEEGGWRITAGFRKERDYKVYWKFSPVSTGTKTITVRFRLRDVLTGSKGGENRLAAAWIGQFRVPVRHATYVVVFPRDVEPAVTDAVPAGLRKTREAGRTVLVFEESNPWQDRLSLRFSPGIVNGALVDSKEFPELPGIIIGCIVLAGGLMLILHRRRSRGEDGGDGGGSADTSVGGGCGGGGCGGGGCGGGGCGG